LSNRGPTNLVSVKSSTDGNTYQVQNLPDKQEACELIAHVRGKLDKLIQHYKEDPSAMGDPRIKVLVERFNPSNMYENNIEADSTSYSENKGEKIAFCLNKIKSEESKLIDINTLTFVAIHELAHVMTQTEGHTLEYWGHFKFLLIQAKEAGIYDPVDYKKKPEEYCGMTITDNPYYNH
jgi:hypothetical protein